MAPSQFSLCWDSYKTNVCNGFSALQQNGELVDMTLAADGHFVKVHKLLVSLASPYLKELISSAPCQHPVVFLNNMSNKTLCLLLEYIYTGEVLLRADNLTAFAEAAKALHIKGLENIANNENIKPTIDIAKTEPNTALSKPRFGKSRIPPSIEPPEQINEPGPARRVYIKQDNTSMPTVKLDSIVSLPSKEESHEYSETMDDSSAPDDNEPFVEDSSTMNTEGHAAKGTTSNLQFTVSIRGSLQMILNRYIYNLNSTTTRAGLRRWRCVDYRNNKCTAFVITRGNIVLKRANPHNHSFHDKKILAKMHNKTVFSALDEIEMYKEKEKRRNAADEASTMETSTDHNNYFMLEDCDSDMDLKSEVLLIKNQ